MTFVIVRYYPPGPSPSYPMTRRSRLKDEPFNPEEGKREISTIQDQDIGGLERELQLVREMIHSRCATR